MICFSAVAPLAVAADSSGKKRSSSSASARKKSSTAKKSSKSSKSQSRKSKSKGSTAKKKGKSERRTVKTETSQSWIDELPEVELPTVSGPPEEELLEPVDIVEVETEPEGDSEPEP